MTLNEIADGIADVRCRIAKAVEGKSLDTFETNTFSFIAERLTVMENECRTGRLKPAHERYPELSRIAIETNPAVLPPELGGELIKMEEDYRGAK